MTTKKGKLLTAFVLATSFASPVSTAHAQLIINELMQSNIDCIMDDINEFPDSWVELYNSGTTAVNLNAYSISDEDDPKNAWALPDKTIQPGSYVIVYCDKEETAFTHLSDWNRVRAALYISTTTEHLSTRWKD